MKTDLAKILIVPLKWDFSFTTAGIVAKLGNHVVTCYIASKTCFFLSCSALYAIHQKHMLVLSGLCLTFN